MTTTAPPHTKDSATGTATIAKGAGIGMGFALIANLVVFAVGNAGAQLTVVVGDTTPSDLVIGAVIAASIVPIIVGALGLWVFERFLANGFRIWAIVALTLAVVSLAGPAGLDLDTRSKIALAVMHLVVGVSAVAGQAVAQRNQAHLPG